MSKRKRHASGDVKALREIVGGQVADALGEFDGLDFRRFAPPVPDRSILRTEELATNILAKGARSDG